MQERIPTLPLVLDPQELGKHIDRVLPAHWGVLQDIQIRVLQLHRTSRCVVNIHLQTATGTYDLIGKVYADDRSDVYLAMKQINQFGFGNQAEFSIPQVVGFIPELRLLLQEKIEGSLATAVFLNGSESERALAAERCARWLAHFHTQAVKFGPMFSISPELLALWVQRLAELAGSRIEHLKDSAALLWERLEDAASKFDQGEVCACHGTFCHYQIILSQNRVVTLDWDGFCTAHPALDVARFIIDLQCLALQKRGSLNAFDGAVEAFYKTYTALKGFGVSKYLPFFKAAHCLKIAKVHLKPANASMEMAQKMLAEGIRTLEAERDGQSFIPGPGATAKSEKVQKMSVLDLTQRNNLVRKLVLSHDDLLRYVSPSLPISWGTLKNIGTRLVGPNRRRSYTLDLTLDTTTGRHELIGKVYAKDHSDVFRMMKQISKSGFGPEETYSIPQPFAYLPAICLLLQETVAGPSAEEIFSKGNRKSKVSAAERCAGWLAQYHATDCETERVFSRDRCLVSLARWTHELTALVHPLADKASQLLRQLKAAAPSLDKARQLPTLRDFGPRQVILAAGRTVMFDWDGFCLGDPGKDVASFIIKLQGLALKTYGSLTALDFAVEIFYQTYAAKSQFNVARQLSFYKALSCLRNAKQGLKLGESETSRALLDEGLRIFTVEELPS